MPKRSRAADAAQTGTAADTARAIEIASRAQAYFEACDATRERVVLKNGDVRYYQIPYTPAGLCAALNVPRTQLDMARGCSLEDAVPKALRLAALRVEQHIMERALLGELEEGTAALLLEGFGYRADRRPRRASPGASDTDSDGSLTVTLEDPEGLSR